MENHRYLLYLKVNQIIVIEMTFFDKLKNELDVDVENMNKLTETSKTDFLNYPIFKWIDTINLKIEFGNYDKFYLVGESKYPEDSCLLAESDSLFCIFRFYDAA